MICDSLKFEFVNYDNEIQADLKNVVGQVSYFNCLSCGMMLHFWKKYYQSRHNESITELCHPVTCPKCGSIHRHQKNKENDEDECDEVWMSEQYPIDPLQLCFPWNEIKTCAT